MFHGEAFGVLAVKAGKANRLRCGLDSYFIEEIGEPYSDPRVSKAMKMLIDREKALQFVVRCQELQPPLAVHVRMLLVPPVSQAVAPAVLQPPPMIGCAATAGHAHAEEGAAPLQVWGAAQSVAGFWKVHALPSTAQLMVPVLPLLQYVPAPAAQNGSTTQVHAALGAAPVQA